MRTVHPPPGAPTPHLHDDANAVWVAEIQTTTGNPLQTKKPRPESLNGGGVGVQRWLNHPVVTMMLTSTVRFFTDHLKMKSPVVLTKGDRAADQMTRAQTIWNLELRAPRSRARVVTMKTQKKTQTTLKNPSCRQHHAHNALATHCAPKRRHEGGGAQRNPKL